MKSRLHGFTLIELIVVIAIIGILMAILVPNLITYITDARTTSANANANTVYRLAANYFTKANAQGATVTGVSDVVFTVADPTLLSVQDNFGSPAIVTDNMFSETMSVNLGSGVVGTVYAVRLDTKNNVICAWWAKSDTEYIIGAYPRSRSREENDGSVTLTTANVSSFVV
jgi:prepilin-type N-terminal cleavage/methylation domain-containing protein